MSRHHVAAMLRASLESAGTSPDNAVVAAAAPDSEMETPMVDPAYAEAENVDGALVDVHEAAAAVDEVNRDTDELVAAHEGLEAIALSLESAIESGGLTPQAAEYLNRAVGIHLNRIGIEEQITSSLESYGGATTRITATRISVEGIGEKLKAVWAAIVTFVKRVWEAVGKFVSRLVDASERLKVSAMRVLKQAKTVSGIPKEKKVALGNLAAKLAVGDRVDPNLSKNMLAVQSALDNAVKLDDEEMAAVKQLGDAMERLTTATDANFDEHYKAVEGIKVGINSTGFPKSSAVGDGKMRHSTPVLPGNRTFYIELGDGKVNVGSDREDVTVPETSLATMSVDDIETVAKEVIKFSETFGSMKKKFDDGVKNLLKGDIKVSENLSPENQTKLRKAFLTMRTRSAAVGQVSAKVAAHGLSVAAASLGVAKRSLAQYKGGKAPESKAA